MNVNVLKRVAGRMSDHIMVEARMKVCASFRIRANNMGGKRLVKRNDPGKETCVKRNLCREIL